MHNNKLLKILSTFSEEDLRRFKKMLQSPFFTTNKNLLALFKYLHRYYPDFSSPKLMKIYVFRKLFPKQEYSDIKLRNLFSEMTRLAEDYLIHQELKNKSIDRKKILMDIYGQKQLLPLFNREADKIQQELGLSSFDDMLVYETRYQTNLKKLDRLPSKALLDRFQLLLTTSNHLEYYYQLSKAKINAELESFRGILSTQQTTLIEDGGKVDWTDHLLFQLYEKITKLYQTSDLRIFNSVKKKLITQVDQIRPSLQIELLMHLINFTIRQMKKDDRKFNQLAFELYRFGLEKNILIQNGQLHDTAFLNIAVAGSKSNAFEWTQNFLEEYDSYVSEEVRKDVKTLAYANLLFHRKLFSKAIDDLSQHSFIHPLYLISSRIHALRCYYELYLQDSSYHELLISQGQAFEKFVRRSKVYNDSFSKACLNFVSMLSKMANWRLGKKMTKAQQQIIFQKLEEQEHTISRSWLLEKIKE